MGPVSNRIFGWLAMATVVLGSLACVEQRSEEHRRSTLVYGYENDVFTFDPTRQRMMKENALMAQVLEGMTRWSNDIEIMPTLALRWENEDDCKVWRFYLRDGVKFHDGLPFTSEAVRLHFERTMDPATAATRRHLVVHIDRVETPDPLIVEFHLNRADCTFPELISGIFASIPSPASVANRERPLAIHPVGTGPFIFGEWVKDQVIHMRRNPDYWDAQNIHIEHLEFRPVRENTTRLILLEQGTLDMADVFFAQVNVAKSSPDIKLQIVPQLAVRYIGFNTQKPPFDNVLVRRAANYAINREEMIKYMFFGVGEPARGVLPPVLPGYNKNVNTYEYNPEKAKELLAEAGYPNGFTVNFWSQDKGEYRVAAEAAVEYLRKVGINAEMRIIDAAVYWRKFDEYSTPTGERYPTREGVFDMFVGGWVGGEAEYDYLKPLFLSTSTSNSCFYNNPAVDAMLAKYQAEPEKEKRMEIINELQELIVDDAPWIFAYHSQVNVGLRPHVTGFRVNPSSRYFFQGVRLDGGTNQP